MNLHSIALLIRSRLWLQILIAMVLGIGLGLLLSPRGGAMIPEATALATADWLKLPGSIFLNLIQMVVVTLITSSIILGICSSGSGAELRRLGLRIFPYFVTTTMIAVAIGIVIALVIAPGIHVDSELLTSFSREGGVPAVEAAEPSSLPDQIARLIPTNVGQAYVNLDMLQIVIYAIFVGIAIVALPKRTTGGLVGLLEGVQDVSLKIVSWAMMLAPYAVFGLLADISIRVGLDAVVGMSVYVGTVLLGLVILFGVYLLIVTFVARRNPIQFFVAIREVVLLAFSTSSSAAVMPLSMKVAQEKLDVSASTARFIVPLGATINMDGTAIYQVIAALFLCQVFGIDLSMGEIIVLSLTTVGASIGSPSTPGVGIVILATIVYGLGVPASGIALILGVDRILDMARTSVNVTGDLTASVVVDRWVGGSVMIDVESPPEPA